MKDKSSTTFSVKLPCSLLEKTGLADRVMTSSALNAAFEAALKRPEERMVKKRFSIPVELRAAINERCKRTGTPKHAFAEAAIREGWRDATDGGEQSAEGKKALDEVERQVALLIAGFKNEREERLFLEKKLMELHLKEEESSSHGEISP